MTIFALTGISYPMLRHMCTQRRTGAPHQPAEMLIQPSKALHTSHWRMHRAEVHCTARRHTAQVRVQLHRPEEHPADGRASRRRKAYGAWRGKKQGHDKSKDMTKARTRKKDSTL